MKIFSPLELYTMYNANKDKILRECEESGTPMTIRDLNELNHVSALMTDSMTGNQFCNSWNRITELEGFSPAYPFF